MDGSSDVGDGLSRKQKLRNRQRQARLANRLKTDKRVNRPLERQAEIKRRLGIKGQKRAITKFRNLVKTSASSAALADSKLAESATSTQGKADILIGNACSEKRIEFRTDVKKTVRRMQQAICLIAQKDKLQEKPERLSADEKAAELQLTRGCISK